MTHVQTRVSADATRIEIDAGKTTLDAAGLDAFIRQLIEHRAQMTPVHAAEPYREGAQVYTGDNMLWDVRADRARAAVDFAVQNPGLGWLSVALSRAQVEDLMSSFQFALAEIPEVR
ncbi:hypothetical protein PY365_05815 [Roseiarcaceae bacterium H3SJ34-1]|uniref:hypothetical protein n=1 Tax=Terripilifer ovatus TaxID=3032367 RepID=UPI003AB9647A|nr:hypothetical protein [Roseiarcaceae bacterium H3SJ34-1]